MKNNFCIFTETCDTLGIKLHATYTVKKTLYICVLETVYSFLLTIYVEFFNIFQC